MPVNSTRDLQSWAVQNCQLVTHETTGLRFFVYDNHDSRQTDVAIVREFADPAAIEAEAKAAGYTAEEYSEFLADQAMEAATRHVARTAKRH